MRLLKCQPVRDTKAPLTSETCVDQMLVRHRMVREYGSHMVNHRRPLTL